MAPIRIPGTTVRFYPTGMAGAILRRESLPAGRTKPYIIRRHPDRHGRRV